MTIADTIAAISTTGKTFGQYQAECQTAEAAGRQVDTGSVSKTAKVEASTATSCFRVKRRNQYCNYLMDDIDC